MKKILGIFVLSIVGLSLLSCSSSTDSADRPPLTDDPVRTPSQLTAEETALLQGSNKFGFVLFNQVLSETEIDTNVFISPLSASYALAMTWNGAANETREAMTNTLQLSGLSVEAVNKSYQNLTTILNEADPGIDINIANSIWCREGLGVAEEFVGLNKDYFDALVSELDFGRPDAADIINGWVDDKTNGKIDQIVKPPISRDIIMYLMNAVYFKALWTNPFDSLNTTASKFLLAGGGMIDCGMMHLYDTLPMLTTDEFVAVRLPYGDDGFCATFILPDTGYSVEDLAANITDENWALWSGAFSAEYAELGLPRFKFPTDISMKPALKAMGMEIAFSPAADFSNMITDGSACIDNVKHKAFVQVDELGTEAAAVTLVSIMRTSIGPGPTFNRPFLFVISEEISGAVLFMGKIANPVWED